MNNQKSNSGAACGQRQPRPAGRADRRLIDEETGWYRALFFLARMEEAIEQTALNGKHLTLLRAHLPLSKWGEDSQLRIYATVRLSLMEREPRVVDLIFGRLSEDEFAVCVLATQAPDVARTVRRLLRQLQSLPAETGVAMFPEDGTDVETLITSARESVVPPANVAAFEAFRRRHQPRVA